VTTQPLSSSQISAKHRPPEVTPEDRVHLLQAEVGPLACLPPVEQLYWLPDCAKQHGIEETKLKQMVEAQVRANEKIKREAKSEERKSEVKAEKQRSSEQRKQEREQREKQRADEKAKKADKQEAIRKQRERTKEFIKLLRVPSAEQEARLVALAKRIDEGIEFLRSEFAQFVEVEEASRVSGITELWPEPVETGSLLTEVMTQVRRYVVVHSDAETTAIVLWIFFAWVHEIAVNSPMLVISASDGDEGKSTLCAVIGRLTPRAYLAAEMNAANLFRFVDHVHPTLIIDDADKLLPRKPDLVHVINVSWTRDGAKIPRQDQGVTRWFDVFCPKVIAGVNVQMPATTATRRIPIRLWPKLADEKVDKFGHTDDDTFITLRRKLARWAADNAAALKAARPAMPAEMINRREDNWTLQLAIADLAGGAWPKAAREAAIQLSRQRRAPSEGKRLLAAFRDLFEAHGPMLTSANVQKLLTADPTSDWVDFRGHKRPISQREIALILDGYEIHPQVIRQRGGKPERSYASAWFEKAFRHYLQQKTPLATVTSVTNKSRKKKPKK
jgi:hypothetical protein